jgi:hypothetical protein
MQLLGTLKYAAAVCASLLLLTGCAPDEPDEPQDATDAPEHDQVDDTASERDESPSEVDAALRRARLPLYERPLELPLLEPDEDCPRSEVGDAIEGVAQTYGEGPVYATLGTWDATISLAETGGPGPGDWYYVKVLWSVEGDYDGVVVVRGRQLDGAGAILFAPDEHEPSGQHLTALAFPAGTGTNARHFPTAVLLYQTGCYAFQIDGPDFTDVIVFEARE